MEIFLNESGVTKRLADTAKGPLIDIVTILIGITVGASTQATPFLTAKSIGIFGLGAISFGIPIGVGLWMFWRSHGRPIAQ